ncbi:hypothetical protein HK100_006258, partial [Physocladia obscura]
MQITKLLATAGTAGAAATNLRRTNISNSWTKFLAMSPLVNRPSLRTLTNFPKPQYALRIARERRPNPLSILSAFAAPIEVEDVVSNILYNTPPKPLTKPDRHILTLLVANETGVLSRISG